MNGGRGLSRCWQGERRVRCSGSAAQLRKNAQTDAKSAERRGPHGNRTKIDKPQFVNQFGIYEDDSVTLVHQCSYAGRRYIHLTLQNGTALLSLVITRKQPGESLSGLSPALSSSEIPVYQSAAHQYEVASFDAGSYLAFVASELRDPMNLQIAARLAPTVHEFLAKMPV